MTTPAVNESVNSGDIGPDRIGVKKCKAQYVIDLEVAGEEPMATLKQVAARLYGVLERADRVYVKNIECSREITP